VIERASSADLAFLAMDSGNVPQQFGVILLLERPAILAFPSSDGSFHSAFAPFHDYGSG